MGLDCVGVCVLVETWCCEEEERLGRLFATSPVGLFGCLAVWVCLLPLLLCCPPALTQTRTQMHLRWPQRRRCVAPTINPPVGRGHLKSSSREGQARADSARAPLQPIGLAPWHCTALLHCRRRRAPVQHQLDHSRRPSPHPWPLGHWPPDDISRLQFSAALAQPAFTLLRSLRTRHDSGPEHRTGLINRLRIARAHQPSWLR